MKSGKRKIRVIPGASRDLVEPQDDGSLRVYVTAPPEKGRANKAVINLLAKYFDIKKSQIDIISGHMNRDKIVYLAG